MNAGSVAADPAGRAPAAGRPLRILAVGNMYPPHHTGGYERAWQDAMEHARGAGHTVRILASDHREPGVTAADEPDVHRTLRWYWDARGYAFHELGPRGRVALERHNHRELERHLRSFAPDVVSWWSMGCMSLSLIEQVRRAGIAAVFVVHDDWLVYGWRHDAWIRIWHGWRRALAPAAERVLGLPTRVRCDRAGSFVFNSEYTLRRARAAGVRAPGATVVHPGIERDFRQPAAPHAWQWRIACIGRIDRHKGVDLAVAALAHLPDAARLTIWGTGDEAYLAELRAQAERSGVADRVRFAGFAGGAELVAAYAEADVIVFPVRWEEPFGLVPLEAMGLGRPVVGSSRGGGAEYLRDGENALLVAPDDTRALAEAVTRLAGDDVLRTRLVDGGRRTAARFTAERFAADTVAEIVRAAR